MKKLLLLSLTLNLLVATQESMQMMLERAQHAFSTQKSVNAQREARFLDQLTNQKALLLQAQKERDLLKQESLKLNNEIDANEKALGLLEEKLHQRSGNLGELYGVVRQSSGDFLSQAIESPLSSRIPDRLVFLETLSKTKKLPNIEDLSHFWYLILQELTQQGKIQTITTPLIATNGMQKEEKILLQGPFASISQDGFVQYLPKSRNFALLAKQPERSYTNIAIEAFETTESFFETVLDPTRGQLLALATEAPSFFERIEQGSTVGYLIILLGLIGLGFGGYKGLTLAKTDLAMINKEESSMLIQLNHYYQKHQSLSLTQLELRMEEHLSKAKTLLESGLAMIKLLAAVSPLMGLLGTVTGMIATFSAITLFGTGDPKLMAGGISQALITTVEGLIVAIPLLFTYTLLNSRAKVIQAKLEEEALRLLSEHK